uniref:Polyheme membrane-associated cytochrome c n=1 Tax=Geobacter sp. (strain M21) TaxID=443144 RepID=C6E1L5_GEOSM
MSKKVFKYSAVIASLLMTALFAGCGTSHKEGNLTAGNVAKVDESLCAQCHGSAREKLTGRVIYDDYKDSVHALQQIGCQDCHGGGAQHNGVGPIPFPKPDAAQCATCHDDEGLVTAHIASKHANAETEDGRAKCNRCHTHEGAVLSAQFGFTGDGTVIAAMVNAPGVITDPQPIKCNTCHMTHKPQELRIDAGWAPSATVGIADNTGSDQYKLCTQCHTYINPTGDLTGSGSAVSGTVQVGYHNTTWNRVIASTHYDDPATPGTSAGGIEGYVIRTKGGDSCFDCHGHESKTNTNKTAAADATVHNEWAKSGHAGGILKVKLQAATDNPVDTTLPRTDPVRVQQGLDQVDAVMAAKVTDVEAQAWNHYNWDDTSTRGGCQKCHTSTGAANYMTAPTTYAAANNNFSHLSNWNAVGGSTQNEVLYCWGCHTNAGTGDLRTPGAIKADYKFQGTLAQYPDVKASNVCISCHVGQASGNSITDLTVAANDFTNVSFVNSHYMAAAGLMYVKIGYTNFVPADTQVPGTTGTGIVSYGQTLTSTSDDTVDVDGAAVKGKLSSTHRKLGTSAINGDSHNTAFFVAGNLDSDGPCVTCHYAAGDHTLEMEQKAVDGVCSKCHEVSTVAELEEFIEEEGAVPFENAIDLALKALKDNYNISYNPAAYPYFYDDNIGTAAKDWTRGGALTAAEAEKLMGACFNINVLKRDPAAHAHARTYARRLLYDSIDFLDDKTMNLSTGATALASLMKDSGGADIYTKGADSSTGTTESFKYLAGYNRTTHAWNASERP